MMHGQQNVKFFTLVCKVQIEKMCITIKLLYFTGPAFSF